MNLYSQPKEFFAWPTEIFKDKKFIKCAVNQIKSSFIDNIERKEVDDYSNYAKEFLIAVRKKVVRERQNLKNVKKEKNKERNKVMA